MKTWLTILISMCFSILLFAQEQIGTSIYFDTDKHDLKPESIETLNTFKTKIETLKSYSIAIEAHTDNRGSVKYNYALAERRASSVRGFLEDLELYVDKIEVSSFGEDKPAFNNDDKTGRSKNRRVDVIVTYYETTTAEQVTTTVQDNFQEIFEINPTEKNLLTFREGTKVLIQKNIFENKQGKTPTEPILIIMKEAYKPVEMILQGITTTSNGKMLVSGGMINIEAKDKNEESLRLKTDKTITVIMPTDNYQTGMSLFKGQENSTGAINWLQTEIPAKSNILSIPPKPEPPNPIPNYVKFTNEGNPPNMEKPLPPPPFNAKKPNKAKVKYNPSGIDKITTTDKKRSQKESEIYAKRLENYKKKQRAHNIQKDKYEMAMNFYNKWTTYQNNLKTWQIEKEKSLKRFEELYDNSIGNVDFNTLNQYVFEVNELGWINCDKFYKIKEKARLSIKSNAATDDKVYIVFKNLNSIMPTIKKGNLLTTNSIPKKEPFTIVGIKVEEGQVYLATLDLSGSTTELLTLDYQPTNMVAIREILKGQL